MAKEAKTSYSVIGAMAGSSMDGLDLVHTCFTAEGERYSYLLEDCTTISYPTSILETLQLAPSLALEQQKLIDHQFGDWIAGSINAFISGKGPIDLLAVHGHTVVHHPKKGISWQLGNGLDIASQCAIPTVTEFRSLDVQLGGQGAPLVPFGDFILFSRYDACLNLGGIANISIKDSNKAWDICPCNQILNYYALKLGAPFDEGGKMARKGALNEAFYKKLRAIPYFSLHPPKSLPNKFIDTSLLDSVAPEDGLHTYCHLIADLVADCYPDSHGSRLLISGGGAFNHFLIELISNKLKLGEVHLPDEKIITFKEALIFGFLGLRKLQGKINVLASVTGASKDTCSGVIHVP